MQKIKKIKLANTEYDIAVDKDWSQNDTDAVEYIKNRPFYTDMVDGKEVVTQLDTKYIPVDNSTIKVEDGKLTAKLIDTAKVEWKQTITSGTEIAKITINGTETAVYAPQPTGSDGNTTYTLKVGGANNAKNEQINNNGLVYLKLVDGAGTVVNQYSITGDGGATVTSDKDGNITFYNPPAAEIAPNLTSKDTTKVETLKIYETTREDYESATNIEDTSFYLVPDPPTVTIAPIDSTGEVVEVETLKIYTTTKGQYENTPVADLEDNSLYLIPDPSAWTKVVDDTEGSIEIHVEDKTEYYFPNATSLSITGADNPHYECWISAGSSITTITFSLTVNSYVSS